MIQSWISAEIAPLVFSEVSGKFFSVIRYPQLLTKNHSEIVVEVPPGIITKEILGEISGTCR